MAYDSFELNAVQKTSREDTTKTINGLIAGLKVDGARKANETSELGTNPIKTQTHQKVNTYIPSDKMDKNIKEYGNMEMNYFQGKPQINSPFFRR